MMTFPRPRFASACLIGKRAAQISVLLALGAVAAAQVARTSHSAAEAALLKAEDDLFAADVHHDAAAIQRGFADEAIFVHANGRSQTKSDYLHWLDKASFQSIEGHDRVARIFGKVGIVRGIKQLVLSDGRHLSGSYLTVYIKQDGRWQMLDEQSSPAMNPENK